MKYKKNPSRYIHKDHSGIYLFAIFLILLCKKVNYLI